MSTSQITVQEENYTTKKMLIQWNVVIKEQFQNTIIRFKNTNQKIQYYIIKNMLMNKIEKYVDVEQEVYDLEEELRMPLQQIKGYRTERQT